MAIFRHQCVLLLIIHLALAARRLSRGKLKPDDPTLAVGDTLSLHCTLSRSSHHNASSIAFVFSSHQIVHIPNKFVMVVNKRVAVLTYPHIGIEYNETPVCCIIIIADTLSEVDCQHLLVGYLPNKPVVDNIQVSKNLTFSWKVAPNLVYMSTYKGYWKTSNVSEFKPCSRSCGPCNLHQLYTIMVVGRNVVGNVTSEEVQLYPRDYAQPSVPGLHTRVDKLAKPRHCVTVSWTPLRSWQWHHNILYNVSVVPPLENNSKFLIAMSNHSEDVLSVQFCSLLSYTVHTFTLRAVFIMVTRQGNANPFGLWSSLAVDHQITPTTIPARGAEVTKGGFHVREVKGHTWTVSVYWKHIPKLFRNGEILGYRITYISPQNVTTSLVGPESSSAMLDLVNLHSFYHIFVDAKTSAGYNEKRIQSMITVGGMAQLSGACANFTVFMRNKTSIRFEWTVNSSIVGYTAYWCQGSQYDFVCDTELQWQTLPANARNFNLKVPANHTYNEYLYGLSVESTQGSSGIQWSACIYEDGQIAAPPMIKIKERYSNSLQLSLEKPLCAESRGYITGYNVYYCWLNDMSHCSEKKVKIYIPVDKAVSYVLQGLQHEQKYHIEVESVSAAGLSHPATLEAATKERIGFASDLMILVSVGAFVLLLFCIIGAWCVYKCPVVCFKWMNNLPIKLPEKNQDSLDHEERLNRVDYGYEKHPSGPEDNPSTPILQCHPPPCVDEVGWAKPGVTAVLSEDNDYDEDTCYARTKWQVEPLFKPISSSHKIVTPNDRMDTRGCSKAAVSLSLKMLRSECRFVDTPNNLCDDNDIKSTDGDDEGYCKTVKSQCHLIVTPNISGSDVDSDDDNIYSCMTRVSPASPISRLIRTLKTDVNNMSNINDNDCSGYSKVVIATNVTPNAGVDDTDVGDIDGASGDYRVVTANIHQGDNEGSGSNDISSYSRVTNSNGAGDATSLHVSDTGSSDDEDDITGYSKILSRGH